MKSRRDLGKKRFSRNGSQPRGRDQVVMPGSVAVQGDEQASSAIPILRGLGKNHQSKSNTCNSGSSEFSIPHGLRKIAVNGHHKQQQQQQQQERQHDTQRGLGENHVAAAAVDHHRQINSRRGLRKNSVNGSEQQQRQLGQQRIVATETEAIQCLPEENEATARPLCQEEDDETDNRDYYSVDSNIEVEPNSHTLTSREEEMAQQQQQQRSSDNQLVEAMPVRDDGSTHLDLPVALPFDRKGHGHFLVNERKWKVAAIVFLLAIVGFAIALGVALGRRNTIQSRPTEQIIITERPSFRPSMAPSDTPLFSTTMLPDYTRVALQDISSPQSNAIEWVIRHKDIETMPEWRKLELFALATIYYSMDGDDWPDEVRNDWLIDEKHECYWYHSAFGIFDYDGSFVHQGFWNTNITCNESAPLSSVGLGGLNLTHLSTTIPREISLMKNLRSFWLDNASFNNSLYEMFPKEFFQLTNMESLAFVNTSFTPGNVPSELGILTNMVAMSMEYCGFSGTIPTDWGRLTNLSGLGLTGNNLEGSIPSEIGRLIRMSSLGLAFNNLDGNLPSEVFMLTDMEKFLANNNELTGSIPTEVGKCSQLTELHLMNNRLQGRIPTELGLLLHLRSLLFGTNTISGSIPSEVGFLTRLSAISVASNLLTGSIPSEVGNLSGMSWYLYLYDNLLEGFLPSEIGRLKDMTLLMTWYNSLSGTIPLEFFSLKRLDTLAISQNRRLSGTLPTEIASLSNMTFFAAWGNEFVGTMPSEIGLLTKLTYLDTKINLLNGSIPTEIGALTSLQDLYLSSNKFAGSLPSEFGFLSNIQAIGLYSNFLSGNIPTQIGHLGQMTYLGLQRNALSGLLPSELGLLTGLVLLSLRTNSLSGTLPRELQQWSNLESLYLSDNAFMDSLPDFLFRLQSLQYLNLDHNPFRGTIATEFGLLQNLIELSLADCSLTGTVPLELGRLVTSHNLRLFNVINNALKGVVPEDLCLLRSNSACWFLPVLSATGEEEPCSLDFDCTPTTFCGCDCACSSS